jgi:hypothetical protein
VIFLNDQFFFGIVSLAEHFNVEELKTLVKEDEAPEVVDKKFTIKKGMFQKKKDAIQFSYVGNFKEKKVHDFLLNHKFALLK